MLEKRTIETGRPAELVDLTDEVAALVAASGITEGVAVVTTQAADAGIVCTARRDPKIWEDILDDFHRIWPARNDFLAQGAPEACAAHTKAAVAGQGMDFIVENGALCLGQDQGIFFAEYCGPQTRSYCVKVLGR